MTHEDASKWRPEKHQKKEMLKGIPPKPKRFINFKSFFRRRPPKVFFIALVVSSAILFIASDIRQVFRLANNDNYPVSTQILDRNGKLIYEIYTEKRRTPVALSDLPPYVKEATIAIEDKDFYRHHGFDPTGIVRAMYYTLFRSKLEGGSTITQQLVKTALLSPERTLPRKIRELYLAIAIELLYPKDKIIEMYLSQVPYGGTAWGIEAASQTYFGKPAKDLSLAEAALLAGLPAAPTRFSPFGANPSLAKDRQIAVLRRMVEDGYIKQDEADKATKEPLELRKPEGAVGIHFALWVKEQLVEKYGERAVEQGGLRVKTTLDLDLQNKAENVVKTEVGSLNKQKVKNGAALVTNPKTGEILAMVGSKDYFANDEDGKVNVTISQRQPGSSIKPLNYALGLLDKKVTPATVLLDEPTCFKTSGQPLYCPVNYDRSFHGVTQVRFALANSFNIPAVKMLTLNGVAHFIDFARTMGITTLDDPTRYGLSLTLGGGEVKMTDMAVAYGVFANEGVKQPLVSVLEVKDWQGKTLNKTEIKDGDRVLPLEVAFLISHILLDNNARSAVFGTTSYLNVSGHPEVSVKTGTTNDRRDNWTIGYTKDAVVVSWVGNNDNTPMAGAVSGISGASPIWNHIIKYTLDKFENGDIAELGEASQKHTHPWPHQPDTVMGANVCATSGMAVATPSAQPEASPVPDGSTPQGCQQRFEYFLEDTVPTQPEVLTQMVHTDKTTNQLATTKTPPENLDLQNHQVIIDPLGATLCLDCTPQTEPTIIDADNLPSSPHPQTQQ